MAAPAKKQKTEEAAVAVVEEEQEQDQKRDATPKIKETVAFLTPDTTLNVMPSSVGNMLVALDESGLNKLVAGARASVGVKSGRHMFEAKIVQQQGQSMVRIGFAAEGSLFLGEDDNSVCFDNQGSMVFNKKPTKCSKGYGKDIMVAVVLNLDASSPNANTISFFKDGKRASQPQALPESLKGKTLFPAVSFKSSTVHFNFGAPVVPLPFKCKVMSEASQKDAVVTKYDEPADGKYTALFPVGLPDEGSFDWLDSFLEKNPGYTELSERAFVDWALKSGLSGGKKQESNDKPNAGIQELSDMKGMKKALMQIAGMAPRNFVVMEVKGNLIKEERAATLAQFKTPVFKTVAEILVGEPPSSFKRLVQSKVLAAKQEASNREHKATEAKEKREWAVRKRTKDAEKAKKKMEKVKKKSAELAKKKAEEIMKKRKAELEAKKRALQGLPVEEEKAAEEEKPAEESEEEAEEPEEPEPVAEEPPKVAGLTAEEKAVRFFKHQVSDLTPFVLNTTFTKFTLPDAEEGFDSVKYSWNKEKEAAAYMKEWVGEKKQTTRVEDITPSADFKKANAAWQSALASWKGKQNDYKAMVSKKLAEKNAKIAKKAAAEKRAKLEAERKAAAAEKAKAEGKEVEEKAEEKAPMEVEEEEEEPEPEIDFDGIDVFGVDDICDIGGKMPIFKDFGFEDFLLMGLRAELHLLVNAFGKDCNDPDRTGVHLDHLAFYYQKYFGKQLSAQAFGVQTTAELVELVNDTIVVNKSVIESLIPAELESQAVFIKTTEEARRARNLQVDMGNVAAKLKIPNQGGGDGGQKRNWEGQNKGNQQWQQGNAGKGAWGKGGMAMGGGAWGGMKKSW